MKGQGHMCFVFMWYMILQLRARST